METRIDYVDVRSIRLNLRLLFDAISEHALEWKNTLGENLMLLTKENMLALKDKMDELRVIVDKNIKGLELFKAIMQAITTIMRMNVSAELEYLNYQETYNVLRAHGIYFDPEDEQLAFSLQREWRALYMSALYRGQSLEATKERFAQLTLTEINEFCELLAEFVQKFDTEGPGCVGEDMDTGVKLMEDYKVMFNEMEERRLDLVNAEMLFDIPLADYSDYLRAHQDFLGMEHIYKIYKAQRYGREVR